jgi:[protein-PII] uridylyltransferase
VRRPPDGAVTDEGRLAAIRRDLEAVLQGQLSVEKLVASRPVGPSLYERAKPEVPPTEVKTDNEISRDFTVIDIFTEDRPASFTTSPAPCTSRGWTSIARRWA